MAEKQPFEIPQQLRELAETNVEQARAAYGQFLDAMAQAMSGWSTAPSNVTTSGFKVVQERAIQLAKENAEAVSADVTYVPRGDFFSRISDGGIPKNGQPI